MISNETQQKLRDLVAIAEERETGEALISLYEQFEQWRLGSLLARHLNRDIREYVHGQSRETFWQYHTGSTAQIVASAIKRGVLSEQECPGDVLELLRDCRYLDQESTE